MMQLELVGLGSLNFNELDSYQEHLDQEPTNEVYHYTSVSSLHNIINSQSLHLTKIQHQNDKEELKHSFDLVLEKIRNKKEEANQSLENYMDRSDKSETVVHGSKAYIEVLNIFENVLEKYSEEIYIPQIFVTSFSEDPKILSQWRNYANESQGVAIGFDFTNFKFDSDSTLDLLKCRYEENNKRILINDFIDEHGHQYVDTLQSIVNSDQEDEFQSEEFLDGLLLDLLKITSFISPGLKNIHFSEEREWRLVKYLNEVSDDYSIKERANDLCPYSEVFFSDEDFGEILSEIFIGPCAEQDRLEDSIDSLLSLNGFTDCEIKKSNIPIR